MFIVHNKHSLGWVCVPIPVTTFGIEVFSLSGIWGHKNSFVDVLVSDSLPAHALKSLSIPYLPFHLTFAIHCMHSVGMPQYKQNPIQSLIVFFYFASDC